MDYKGCQVWMCGLATSELRLHDSWYGHTKMQRLLFLLLPLVVAAAEPGPAPRVVRLDLDGDILPPGVVARLGSTRFQEISAHRVTISPDGSQAICVDGWNVRVWDLKSGALVHDWPLPSDTLHVRPQPWFDRTDQPFVGGVSEDGRIAVRLRQQSEDNKVIGIADVWDLSSGRKLHSLAVRESAAFAAATISPDGRTMVTADYHPRPYRLRAWDLRTGEGRVLGAHDGQILQLHFIDGGRKVLALIHDNDACAHDLETGKEVYRIPLPSRSHLTVARGGKRFVRYEPPTGLTVYDAVTGKPVPDLKYPKEYANPRALSDDGTEMVCYRTSHTTIWDFAGGKERLEVPAHDYAATAFGHDGKTIVLAGTGLWVVDAATGKSLAGPDPARGSTGGLSSFGWSPDGSSLFVAGPYRKGGTLFDPETGKVLRQLKPDTRVNRWYRPGLCSQHKNWEQVPGWRPELPFSPLKDSTGKVVQGYTVVSADDRFVAVSSIRPDLSRMLDQRNVPLPGPPPKRFDVAVHERSTGVEHFKVTIPAVGEVAFSQDCRRLATLEPDQLRVWDVVTGKLLVDYKVTRPDRPPKGEGFGSALAFSPDSRQLAVNNRDGTILVWDVAVTDDPDRPTAADLPRPWDDLAAADPKVGWAAVQRLASVPDRALPFLFDRVKPAHLPDAATTQKLLVDLDSPAYRTRESATKRVHDLGNSAKPFVESALQEVASPEVRKRLEDVRANVREGDPPRGDDLRRLRALYILERAATKESRAKIEELANGLPTARVTLEAKQVRRRMIERDEAEKE